MGILTKLLKTEMPSKNITTRITRKTTAFDRKTDAVNQRSSRLDADTMLSKISRKNRDHSFSKSEKFSEKQTFLAP